MTYRLSLVAIVLVAGLALSPQGRDFDLVLAGGRVIDGTGNPWYVADLAVKDGRIAAIGHGLAARAVRTINASGKFVSPGFIDIHSHSDRGLGDPALRQNLNMIAQGITLSVVNQDGRSPDWPLRGQRAKYEKQGVGNNVALMVGHGTVRQRVMGSRSREAATEADIAAMRALVEEGMRDGGFGLSAGLEYVPGRFSDTREVIELAKVVRPFGGFYISHERSEGKDPMWKVASDPTPSVDLLAAVEETIAVGREAGIPAVASHLKAKGANYWGASHAATRLIRDARDAGIEVYADQYPYDTSGSDGSTVLIPLWAVAAPGADVGGQLGEGDDRARSDAKKNLSTRLANPADAAKIRRDIDHEIARRGGPSRVVVYDHPNSKYVEKSLADVAADLGKSPADAAIELQLTGYESPGGGRMRGYSLSEIDIEHIMQQDFTATCTDGDTVAFGDGVPHARFYGTMPRKIRRYVVDRGVIGLAFAVRSMTSLAAQIMGLTDRGVIRPGAWADLVVFDLATIADTATFVKPHQYPTGLPDVLVNGVAVVDNGKFTQATPGKVLTPSADGWRAAHAKVSRR
jgi:N-acyl-D-amino-acid deacylase